MRTAGGELGIGVYSAVHDITHGFVQAGGHARRAGGTLATDTCSLATKAGRNTAKAADKLAHVVTSIFKTLGVFFSTSSLSLSLALSLSLSLSRTYHARIS